ncbi:DNA helicase [Candidatus Kaiserbacteria bacterium]|nr:DNA helicase [Candidatus Kaiserbacteria bacterium]
MEFRIADTFTDSLARLTADEQKVAKTTAFDMQINPASPGLSFHKLDKCKDKNFWSIRVSDDIRVIVHKTNNSLMLCYVDHHDKAYRWAERRKLETHPKTGAAQLVEVRERVEEIRVPVYVSGDAPVDRPTEPLPSAAEKTAPVFAGRSEDELLSYGVPPEWLADVMTADEDSLLELVSHLPSEAAEALLELAVGRTPQKLEPVPSGADPFSHPDAQRRFRVMNDVEELERALAFPWDKWTTFLHPAQRQWVERDYSGPARVSGSAGTGKTIVALHRAVYLARRDPDARVLLTTFSDTLANALRQKLHRLISNEPRLAERLEVRAMNAVGLRLYEKQFGPPQLLGREQLQKWMKAESAKLAGLKFSAGFVLSEWDDLVDTWQLHTWEQYRDVKRLGRKTRLSETQRQMLWQVFEGVLGQMQATRTVTMAKVFSMLADEMSSRAAPVFDHVVVDEAQDISVSQLRFLAAIAGDRPNGLFFAGDLGQRIFQTPFSWKSVGVDIRGRSRNLTVNYRTSHQIRMQADRLLGPEVADVDGNVENRKGTVSVFNGPAPMVKGYKSENAEIEAVGEWIKAMLSQGVLPNEIAIFVRSQDQIDRGVAACKHAEAAFTVLDEKVTTSPNSVSISNMHLAKGLEFRAVAVMACDDEVVPLQERIEAITDSADLEEAYNTERHLLYVACTRARDQLLVSGVEPTSEFLNDFTASGGL